MLSIENPSCSSKASAASDLVRAAHEDDQPQSSNFSIRDYVFKSRRKDIRINWPFREQLLQLCVDNGISALLPPLEPPILVRAHCFRKQVESAQVPKCPEKGNGESTKDVALDSLLPLDSLLEERRVLKFQQEKIPDNKLSQSVSEINASSVTSHDLSEGISGEQLKKCRLAAKPFTGSETSSPEGLVSDSITVSDPMASKVCPVCKLFTSTSNTTLNAHIDQCLASDQSNETRDVTEFPKSKVKLAKKRLMVDIYTTAAHCTLEDLDRRNGTNWAASLASVPPANDVNIEAKRMKSSPLDSVNEGNVGDIYVDSNGTKLLILSNDPPALVSRKNFKLKKNGKGFKTGQGGSLTKKKILEPKCSKFMEDNLQSRKLSVAKGFKGEVEAGSKGNHVAEAHQEKEESGSQLLNDHDQVRNSEPSKLGHWVSSKRSGLLRKPDKKDINKGLEKIVITRKTSFRHTQPDSPPSSIPKSRALNLPSSSEFVASPKTKCMNILSTTARGMGGGNKISPGSSNLNSNLLFAGDSLADSSLANISARNESYHPLLKARRSLTSKKSAFFRRKCISLEGMKVDKSERFIIPKKLKNSPILGCSKWRAERYSDANGGSEGSCEDFGLISPRASDTSKVHQYNFSEDPEDPEKESLGMTDLMSAGTGELTYGTSWDPSPEEHVESISREETQVGGDKYSDESDVEFLAERSTSYREAQCGDAISNEVIGQDIQNSGYQAELILQHGECQTDTSSIQEPNPCVTSDGEIGVENTQENSSTLVRIESNQEHNMVVDMESSGSAVSTTSTISPPSPLDAKIKDSEADLVAEPEYNPLPDKLSSLIAGKDKNVRLSPPAREPLCCCSESLSRESQFSNHRKSGTSSLFIKPPTFSSFQQFCPSLESQTESVTMDSSKSMMNVSTPCSQSQSASSPILRLMGKDLVVRKGDHAQLPTVLPCDSDYSPEGKFISFGLPNNVGFISYQNPYNYQIQALANHQIPVPPLQRRPDKFNSSSVWSTDRMVAPLDPWPKPVTPSYQVPEVIVIDDDSHGLELKTRTNFSTLPQAVQNPNLMAPQKLFACFPSQNPYAARVFTSSQREASEGSFMFPSPSSFYFSPTLR